MFGPQASPVVHAQRTWHIGPTTCVFTSRSFARFEREGVVERGEERTEVVDRVLEPSCKLHSVFVFLQTKHDARVILS